MSRKHDQAECRCGSMMFCASDPAAAPPTKRAPAAAPMTPLQVEERARQAADAKRITELAQQAFALRARVETLEKAGEALWMVSDHDRECSFHTSRICNCGRDDADMAWRRLVPYREPLSPREPAEPEKET